MPLVEAEKILGDKLFNKFSAVQKAFRMYDEDKSGELSYDELRRMLRSMNVNVSRRAWTGPRMLPMAVADVAPCVIPMRGADRSILVHVRPCSSLVTNNLPSLCSAPLGFLFVCSWRTSTSSRWCTSSTPTATVPSATTRWVVSHIHHVATDVFSFMR